MEDRGRGGVYGTLAVFVSMRGQVDRGALCGYTEALGRGDPNPGQTLVGRSTGASLKKSGWWWVRVNREKRVVKSPRGEFPISVSLNGRENPNPPSSTVASPCTPIGLVYWFRRVI